MKPATQRFPQRQPMRRFQAEGMVKRLLRNGWPGGPLECAAKQRDPVGGRAHPVGAVASRELEVTASP
jgi:hypothetical protein